MAEAMRVGIIGCGNISGIYLKNAARLDAIDIVAVADLDLARAEAAAKEYGIESALGSGEELIGRDDIDIVLNLTTPQAHTAVNMAAIEAGKHVYCEKPLALNREDGRRTLQAAQKQGVRVGCAPDTVLGGGHQTARKLIDDGAIGQPLSAVAFMVCRGHESWHPDPEFYYKAGGGPMLDMGPYYLSDLTMLLGPVRRLTGSAQTLINPRTITSEPKHGTKIDVETPDHIAGVMDFTNGAVGTIITSFAVSAANLPRIEIYGSEGSLSVPDPNAFGGPVKLLKHGESEWKDVPLSHGYAENWRALGLADMASAIQTGRPHRITGDQAYHVLDVMLGFLDASDTGTHYEVASTFDRPAPMPIGLEEGTVEN